MPSSPAPKLDLRRASPWVRYPLALSVVAFVVWLAVRFGGADQPAPEWITAYLVPVIAVIWCVAFAVRVTRWLRQRSEDRR